MEKTRENQMDTGMVQGFRYQDPPNLGYVAPDCGYLGLSRGSGEGPGKEFCKLMEKKMEITIVYWIM